VSLINPHHDVAVHPKSDSLFVQPLGLTAGEMYGVGAIDIRTSPTPPTPPSLLPSHSLDVYLCLHPSSPYLVSGNIRTSNAVQLGINLHAPLCFLPRDIRFKSRRRTNGAPERSETSGAEGTVSQLPLLVLVTQVNSSRPIRRPAAHPPTPDVQSCIRRTNQTCAAARRPVEEV